MPVSASHMLTMSSRVSRNEKGSRKNLKVHVHCAHSWMWSKVQCGERLEVILVSVLETGLPGIAQTAGSDHHFSICCPNSDLFLTDGWALYLLWRLGQCT